MKEGGVSRVALYARVSTEDQAKEGFSLGAQIERLRSYCQAREWTVYKEYVEDGYSGRDIKRPAYRAMMEEMDHWDVLLVMKMDRIHRNSKNFMEMMDDLRKAEKEFVSMTESLDTSTAMGRFVVDIIQRIAQLESEQIGERVYAGMKQKAQTPLERLDPERSPYLGFNAPFGYTMVDGKLSVDGGEAEVVKEIFEEYVGGRSMRYIADSLNKREILTKKGNKWSTWSIRYILKNPIYTTYLRWENVIKKGSHRPIIDVELFNRAQKARVTRIVNPNNKRDEAFLAA